MNIHPVICWERADWLKKRRLAAWFKLPASTAVLYAVRALSRIDPVPNAATPGRSFIGLCAGNDSTKRPQRPTVPHVSSRTVKSPIELL